MPIVPAEAFQFCGPSYSLSSPVLDAQRCINMYPEPELGNSNTQMGLVGRPGLILWGDTGSAGFGRTLWSGNNRLFSVTGTHLFEMNPNGTVLTDYGAMAGSTGLGPCQVEANGTQLLVCDPSVPAIFRANTVGPAMNLVFNGVALAYLDGFYVSIATGASLAGTNPNQINTSDFLDGTAWSALNYVIRTGASDLTTQLAVLNNQLWIFGQKTIEVWYNAGKPGFPFARIDGATINQGLMAAQTVVKFNDRLMWLGADANGYSQVYMAKGLQPQRVSNYGVEQYITSNLTFPNPLVYPNYPPAWAYGYTEAGHSFYDLTLNGGRIVYDLTTGLWHERTYAGTTPSSFASMPGFTTVNSGLANFVANGAGGKIFQQSLTLPYDDTGLVLNNIVYTRTAPHVSDQNKVLRYKMLEIVGDIGTANPVLTYSNDGGRSFTSSPSFSMLQATDTGFTGQTYKRVWARQLGRSRDRVFKVTITDNTNLIRIARASLDVS